MVNNVTLGPIQVYDNSATSINAALYEVLERIDQIKGVRGRALVFDRMRVDDPQVNQDADTLGDEQAGDRTITGLHTYDRDPDAPFAVTEGSAKVDNLDSDFLDGETGDFYQRYALLVGS